MMDLEHYQRACGRLQLERSHALFSLEEEEKKLLEARAALREYEDAQKLIQSVAQRAQEQAHEKLAGVVTRCLEAVFGAEAFEFRINFLRKRGRTEAELVFVKNGEELDPMAASGGGAVDVASFALRAACLVLARPPLRRLLVLDEPWKHLSRQYRPAARELLLKLSKEAKIQIMLVTHDPEFQLGEVIELC